MPLTGKSAVVTGSTSGPGIAQAPAAAAADVVPSSLGILPDNVGIQHTASNVTSAPRI
jgi:NAD(P)-dependent dehydrogenase (short-subunit alcohol dehydrogenase family)